MSVKRYCLLLEGDLKSRIVVDMIFGTDLWISPNDLGNSYMLISPLHWISRGALSGNTTLRKVGTVS